MRTKFFHQPTLPKKKIKDMMYKSDRSASAGRRKNPVPPVGSPSAREGDKGGEGASKKKNKDMMYKSNKSAVLGELSSEVIFAILKKITIFVT